MYLAWCVVVGGVKQFVSKMLAKSCGEGGVWAHKVYSLDMPLLADDVHYPLSPLLPGNPISNRNLEGCFNHPLYVSA